MLISYSAEEGLIKGARQTFDGDHPCDLCVAITDAKQQDSGPEAPAHQRRGLDSGLELKPCPVPSLLVIAEPPALGLPMSHLNGSSSSIPRLPSGPEPPPPRGV